MGKEIGAREKEIRRQREEAATAKTKARQPQEFCTHPRCKCTSGDEDDCQRGLPKQPQRIGIGTRDAGAVLTRAAVSVMAKEIRGTDGGAQQARPTAAPTKESTMSKSRKPTKAKAKKKEVDRRPETVGNFIAKAGEKGVTMAQLEKKFDMDAHPLRSKIHTAKHDLGFTIDYSHETKRYTGSAPAAAAAA